MPFDCSPRSSLRAQTNGACAPARPAQVGQQSAGGAPRGGGDTSARAVPQPTARREGLKKTPSATSTNRQTRGLCEHDEVSAPTRQRRTNRAHQKHAPARPAQVGQQSAGGAPRGGGDTSARAVPQPTARRTGLEKTPSATSTNRQTRGLCEHDEVVSTDSSKAHQPRAPKTRPSETRASRAAERGRCAARRGRYLGARSSAAYGQAYRPRKNAKRDQHQPPKARTV